MHFAQRQCDASRDALHLSMHFAQREKSSRIHSIACLESVVYRLHLRALRVDDASVVRQGISSGGLRALRTCIWESMYWVHWESYLRIIFESHIWESMYWVYWESYLRIIFESHIWESRYLVYWQSDIQCVNSLVRQVFSQVFVASSL